MRRHMIITVLSIVVLALPSTGCGSSNTASAQPVPARTFVVPHLFETSGTVNAPSIGFVGDVFDTFFYFTHNGGISDVVGSSSVDVTIFLFDETTGLPVVGAPSPTGSCASCTVTVSPTNRKAKIGLDDLLTNEGVFPGNQVFLGFAVITVEGADAEAVGIQCFVAQSHSLNLGVSVMTYVPQEIGACDA